ncbi:MAG: FtsX-like permease family protein [Pyrinomonadaceae bacterium]
MIGGLSLMIWRDWQMHKLRLILTVIGIALGVAVFFAIQTANSALVDSLHLTIEKMAGRATLQIVAGEAGFSQDILNGVRGVDGVAIAEPVTETLATASIGASQRILILGLDTASDLALYNDTIDQNSFILKNPLAFSNRKDSVAITKSLGEKFGLKDGDRFSVDTQAGPIELTVRGLFSETGIGEVYDGNVAVMDIYSAQELFGKGERIDRIDIANTPDVTVDQLQSNLAARLPAGIDVVRPNLRGQGLENSITTMHAGFTIMSLLAISIGIFIIFNSFSISLSQRWKEIGVLRSLGVERSNIQRMFLVEASVLGFIGSLLGVAAGYWIARAALSTVVSVTATIYGFVASTPHIELDLVFAAAGIAVGIVASLVAASLPARNASKLNPALALRNIETRHTGPVGSKLNVVAGLVLIAGGLVLTRFTPPTVGNYFQMLFSVSMLLGMLLLLPLLLRVGARVLRPIMKFLFGAEGGIAVETMARSPRRTVATVGAILIGLSFVFSNASLVQSQKAALNRSIDKAIAADVLITSSEQLHSRTYHFTEATANTIASMPEVARSNALRVTATQYNGVEVSLLAHEMNAYFAISPDLLDAGDAAEAREKTARGEGVLISNNMAFRWNIGLGDTLTIKSPGGELRLPVVGLLEYYRSENGTIFLDRQLYKRYWGDSDVDYLFLDLKPGIDRAIFKDNVLAAIAGSQRAFIYTHDEYKAWVSVLLDQFFMLMYIQMVVAVLVAAIGLVNTMMISVAERRRELGIFRAIGGLRRQVVKLVLLEAITISLIGFAAGVIAGALNTYFLINTAAKIVAGFTLPFTFPYQVMAAAIPLVIIISMISAWLPARIAARLSVVDAIGYE